MMMKTFSLQVLMLLCVPIESLKIVNPKDVDLDVTDPKDVDLDVTGTNVVDVGFGDFELSAAEFETMHKNFRPKLNNMHLTKNAGKKKPVLFIHVHKSLGTWACSAVHMAGGKAPESNCGTHDDGCWSQRDFSFYDNENTCDARREMNEKHGYNFEEIERHIEFDGGDICPNDMSSAIIFRPPIERIKSQMTANRQTWGSIEQWLKQESDRTTPANFVSSHIPYDNFYIRTFIGRDFVVGSGKITREHLELAKKNLAKVDAVIDVEDLLTQIVQLEALTGFEMQDRTSKQVHNDGCKGNTDGLCSAFSLPADGLELLTKQNALDQEFYEYAQKLAKEKMQNFDLL